MSNLSANTHRIYHRHLKALNALINSADAKAASAILYLALDELAMLTPDAPTQDAEAQLVQLNDWLAENAPEHYATVGNTADTTIAVLEALDNSLTLKTAEFTKLSTQYGELATRLHQADADVVRLTADVEQKSRRIADLMAALEEANSRPHALRVVAATPLPDVVNVPANGHDYAHMTTAQIVKTLSATKAEPERRQRGKNFYGTNEELLDAIKQVVLGQYNVLGRAPSKTEFNVVCHEHGLPTVDALVMRLTMKWSEIIAFCGLEAQKSFKERERVAGQYTRFAGTDEELIAAVIAYIKQLAHDLGHVPSRIDFDAKRPDGLPTVDGITRRINVKWLDLVSQAGLKPLVTTAKGGASESGTRFPQGR